MKAPKEEPMKMRKKKPKKEKAREPRNSLLLSLILPLLWCPRWIFYNTISVFPLLLPMVDLSLLRQL
jgi:hypothetical protein